MGTAAAPKVAPGAKVGGRGRGVPPLAGAGLYMRARRYRRCTHARARETGNKTHHGPPVAPPDRAWCVLFRVSLAHVAMYHRCRGLRGRATDRKSAILVVPGGGAFPQFWPLLGHNRWHRASCPHTVHFWKKIFFDRAAVSSRRSSTEEYQSEFFSAGKS